ncbi:hypothetical protein BGZ60DRAFT_529425 [Tricladium varicosporioides]|nr:hypothetical protein BGZ60DRAFT_529425 [Hymenoscyphus varicosporioides]
MHDHDRLPALSGLARRFQEVTGDKYLAGLWKKNLCRELMWECPYPLECRPSVNVAPTWSWLSVLRPIYYLNYPKKTDSCLAKIIDAKTVLAGPNETGAVSSGKITLSGQMKQDRQKSDVQLWGLVEELAPAGLAITDLKMELIDAIDCPLWCLQLFEERGLLLKPSGENYQRDGIFCLGITLEADGVTWKAWFKDSELRTLTIV